MNTRVPTIWLATAIAAASLTGALAPAAANQAPRTKLFAGKVASVEKDGSFLLNVSASKKYPRVTVSLDKKTAWKGLARKGNRVKIGDPVMVNGILSDGARVKATTVTVQDPNELPSQGAGPVKAP